MQVLLQEAGDRRPQRERAVGVRVRPGDVRTDLDEFLSPHDLKTLDIARWVTHPGGPKVLDALARSARLPEEALQPARDCLARVGNLSSSSVLHVLADTMDGPSPDAGAAGVLLAMGPGFCAELVLLQW